MTRPTLETGAIVRARGDRWRVRHVATYGGYAVAELAGAGDANNGSIARFILPFEVIEPGAAASTVPRRVRPVVFRTVARRVLASATPAWTSLRAAATSRLDLLPYQLEPVMAMVRGMSCRFLLADAVGLGKTIQAGLLIAELLARDRDARILIVTPAGVREQWRDELRDRFRIEADVFDAAALSRASATLPVGINPWLVPRVLLTSIDFVKRPDVIRALETIVWDLVAFDEAHGLAGHSDRAGAAELLARRGRRVVVMTATPHSGDSVAYEKLLALGRLTTNDPILIFRRSREDAGLMLRRVTRILRVRPTAAESLLNQTLEAYARRVFREAPGESAPAARLAMMVLARRAASSAASFARSIERRIALLQTHRDQTAAQLVLPLDRLAQDDEEPGEELGARGLVDSAVEIQALRRLHALARAAVTRESKLAAVGRILRRAKEPVIVFTEYRDTLEHLERALRPALRDVATLHGGMSAAERSHEARRFTHGDARVLLATDAASEGLNLQRRCRLVINLELPWTPLRLEQRIGRVDRLGQERRVHAIGLVGRNTAEETVVAALLTRAATANREAPFGGANLRPDAETEAARLGVCRALSHHAPDPKGDRPVACVLTKHRRNVYTAVRLTFVDASGLEVWATVIGTCASLLRTLTAHSIVPAVSEVAALSSAGVAERHHALCRRLRSELRMAVEPLIAREKEILRCLETRHGRLAAPLLQPSLFDRRALRDVEAQQRIADQALATAAERIAALQRLREPAGSGQRLLFAVI